MLIQENISLAQFTTLKIGGIARYFIEARDENQIIEAVKFCDNNKLQLFVLGGGSNLLISDAGFDGVVLKIESKNIEFSQRLKDVFVTANAGEDWDEFVNICVENDLAGVECLSGIPGTIGASPIQNIGAYGQDVSETVQSVKVFDRETLEIKDLSNADCGFSYRTSIFNSTHKERFIVLNVTFKLEMCGKPKIVYRDLQNYFADNANPTLLNTRNAVLSIRREKSMVIDANDPNTKSAGSFFKNPIVSKSKFEEIESRAWLLHLLDVNQRLPKFAAENGLVKIPAAWLIEKSGFHKGFRFGKVGLSTKHALALVNYDDASAKEIVEFVSKIQLQVRIVFDVELKSEPIFVGF
ncbi:MAG: UDP-N-acetylmuramate dehydrogenase [Pyrinomonadaceae bacterium]|nr:UDP-N-acetylmuramate dehydrogenase [Pyrinomonadaceae bacterium]